MHLRQRAGLDPATDAAGAICIRNEEIEGSACQDLHQRPSALTFSYDPRRRVQAIAYAGKCGVGVTADRLLDPRQYPVVAGTRGRNPYLLDF